MSEIDSRSDTAVMIRGLRKAYGNVIAIPNLSMTISRGTVCAVVGRAKSGKSTLLRTVATLERPDAGVVYVCGKDSRRDAGEVRRKVGFMPEAFGRYYDLTVAEYLQLYADAYHLSRSQKQLVIDELLELVDLSDCRDAKVEELPAASKQWLGLARCLIHDPDVLLLDEPMQSMEPAGKDELWQTLRELSGLDKTVILTTDTADELGYQWSQVVRIDESEKHVPAPAGSSS
jgi:ABC-2 type transport system ATP-binding protein